MDGVDPAEAEHLLGLLAGQRAPAGDRVLHLAVPVGHPDDVGVGLDDGPEPLLADLQPATLTFQLVGKRHPLAGQGIALRPRRDLLGHVGGEGEHALHRIVGAPDGEEGQVEAPALGPVRSLTQSGGSWSRYGAPLR